MLHMFFLMLKLLCVSSSQRLQEMSEGFGDFLFKTQAYVAGRLSCDHWNRFLRKTNELLCMCVCVCVGERERERERERASMCYCTPSFFAVSLLCFSDSSFAFQPISLFLARKWLTGSTVRGLHLLCQHHPLLDHHVFWPPHPTPFTFCQTPPSPFFIKLLHLFHEIFICVCVLYFI